MYYIQPIIRTYLAQLDIVNIWRLYPCRSVSKFCYRSYQPHAEDPKRIGIVCGSKLSGFDDLG
jgi:hypothetical protein